MFQKKQICPSCKTGKESYRLDSHTDACPYIDYLRKGKCPFYKPLSKNGRSYSIRDVVKRILNI